MTKRKHKRTEKLISYASVTMIAAAILCQLISMNAFAAKENVSPTDLSPSDLIPKALTGSDAAEAPSVLNSFNKSVSPKMMTTGGDGEVIDSGSCGSEATYTLTSDGTLTISGEGAITNELDDDVKSSVKSITIGHGISQIGDYNSWVGIFNGCSNLTSVVLPEGLEYIGMYAFANCSGLTSITIPSSVKTIGEFSFVGCSNLSSVAFAGESSILFGGMVFDSYSLTSVTIPKGSRSSTSGLLIRQ